MQEEIFGSSQGDHICDSTIEKDLFAMRIKRDAPITYSKERGIIILTVGFQWTMSL